MIKIVGITYGLPGSGKSRYTRNESSGGRYNYSKSFTLELDNYLYSYTRRW